MHPAPTVLALSAVILMGAACAARGGPTTYRVTAGSGTPHDIVRYASRILSRYQFEIERADTSAMQLIIETRWRSRYPLQDEIDAGVEQARTRLTLEARSRRRGVGGPGSDIRQVTITVENMVRLADTVEWVRGFMTPMFRAYIDQLADELETDLHSGVRVF